MNLKNYALNEMKIAGLLDTTDEMQEAINEHIFRMIDEFEKEGHSGFSANYTLNILKKLLNFKPITPLTGKDDEWNLAYENTYQNKRCSSIFKKGKDGQAYEIDGIIFRDQEGFTFTNSYSRVPVTFPYTPEDPKVIDIYVKESEEDFQDEVEMQR